MYRIVTNPCLDMLKARSRRVLPQDVSPSIAPGPPTTAPRSDILWLQPYPDARLPRGAGPEQVARLREGIRLAFVRVVQVLPPRQRAALILHDVLDWSVAEVAAILETTEAAINSALQRGRAATARPREESPALAPRHAEVVDRFVHAWESGDFDDLSAPGRGRPKVQGGGAELARVAAALGIGEPGLVRRGQHLGDLDYGRL